jgi:hypothetical protein
MQAELNPSWSSRSTLKMKRHVRPKQGSPPKVAGLAYAGRTFGLSSFYLDIGPIGVPFPLHEAFPHQLNGGCDDCGGTDG